VWNFDRTGIPRLSKPSLYIFKSVYDSFNRLVFHAFKAEPGEVKQIFYFQTEKILRSKRPSRRALLESDQKRDAFLLS
jgi:hypothetical protein